MKPNRLINEKSPYLLQHSHNPVNWYPWCDEAFEIAKQLDKPIFLSIGYSSCHWCHVMERESFRDPEVASILNDVFVCIKVDREERPDIDSFYMKICQAITGSGGWPLTIIMTPDKKPFFAGTYFPKESVVGRIGVIDLAKNVQNVWKTRRQDVENSANSLIEYIKTVEIAGNVTQLDKEYIDEAYRSLAFAYDKINGGFGSAPKFPTPQNILFLLDYSLTAEPNAFEMASKTLSKMRLGGIFDHIGYGFHRYSTDARWILPHFEKMLYDQAMLLIAYSLAYRISSNKFFLQVADEIMEYVLREMQFDSKAFYTSEDADSEGEEGRFYLFTYDELKDVISDDFELFAKVFNIKPEGNFENPFKPEENSNILYLSQTIEELAQNFGVDKNLLQNKISNWRAILFEYRDKREKPFKDWKILVDWNGLMIAGLAQYFQITKSKLVESILNNYYDFFTSKILMPDGRIYHLYAENESKIDGFLDDYAFSIYGFYESFESTNNPKFLVLAYNLLLKALQLFWNSDENVFNFSSQEVKESFLNTKELYDGAMPSGNSVMYYLLHKFYIITSDENFKKYLDALEKTFSKLAKDNPLAYNFFNFALQKKLDHSFEVIIFYDDENNDDYIKLREYFSNRYFYNGLIVFAKKSTLSELPFPFWKDFELKNGKTTIYFCNNFVCNEPTTNFEFFIDNFEKLYAK
jgi:uncharacterized protein YyaL (SSP411 family)